MALQEEKRGQWGGGTVDRRKEEKGMSWEGLLQARTNRLEPT